MFLLSFLLQWWWRGAGTCASEQYPFKSVCACICLRVRVCVCLFACACACACVRVSVCVCVCWATSKLHASRARRNVLLCHADNRNVSCSSQQDLIDIFVLMCYDMNSYDAVGAVAGSNTQLTEVLAGIEAYGRIGVPPSKIYATVSWWVASATRFFHSHFGAWRPHSNPAAPPTSLVRLDTLDACFFFHRDVAQVWLRLCLQQHRV